MKAKVLVVEDEPAIADNITYALSTEGFEPTHCSTGEEALDLLTSNQFALIILDVGLPDLNGFDLARSIRQEHSTPIIFVTARSDEIDRVLGLELGADDYVVKPFSPRELTARVRAVLRRSTNTADAPQETEHRHGPFRLNHDKRQIHYYDVSLDLSRYEYRILHVLLGRPGKVYSREELMGLVWEDPDMSLERTVDTHVKTIRKKLRAIHDEPEVIVTHRGIGYSLKEY